MDIREKIKIEKQKLEEIMASERMVKSSIEELKSLISQIKKKEETLKLLKAEEARLLAELEN